MPVVRLERSDGCGAFSAVPHGADVGRSLWDRVVVLGHGGQGREGVRLTGSRKRGIPIGQIALPAAGPAPVVEPGANPERAARHDVVAAVAVDVTDPDRRVVLRVGQPRIGVQGQRRRRSAAGARPWRPGHTTTPAAPSRRAPAPPACRPRRCRPSGSTPHWPGWSAAARAGERGQRRQPIPPTA